MEKIIFAHLADLHLGAYRDKVLTDLNFKTFKKAIETIITKKIDFVLFAGDIFNVPLPSIELVNNVAKELVKLKENNIPLYVIGGSHDYSHLGKSYINLFETTKTLIDVSKFERIDNKKVRLHLIKDKKTGAIISGILGRKNGLDKEIYDNLEDVKINDNLSIFMFHCALDDFMPPDLKNFKSNINTSFLPKGFKYYAGGHIHSHMISKYDGSPISYPGPLFPNNFSELKTQQPSFNICEYDQKTKTINIKREFIKTYETEHLLIDANKENPIDLREKIESQIEKKDLYNKIILFEIKGVVEGKITDIKLNEITNLCYQKGALAVLKNTRKLTSSKIENINIEEIQAENLEEEIIKKELEEKTKESEILKSLLKLDLNKQEEEKNSDYEKRIINALEKVFKI